MFFLFLVNVFFFLFFITISLVFYFSDIFCFEICSVDFFFFVFWLSFTSQFWFFAGVYVWFSLACLVLRLW